MEMITKRDTLKQWLFNFAEPPFSEPYTVLAEQYHANLEELHRAERAEWSVDDLDCTPQEIAEVVENRIEWLATIEKEAK